MYGNFTGASAVVEGETETMLEQWVRLGTRPGEKKSAALGSVLVGVLTVCRHSSCM